MPGENSGPCFTWNLLPGNLDPVRLPAYFGIRGCCPFSRRKISHFHLSGRVSSARVYGWGTICVLNPGIHGEDSS